MFGAYVYELSSAEYEKHVLLIDEDGLEEKTGYSAFLPRMAFISSNMKMILFTGQRLRVL